MQALAVILLFTRPEHYQACHTLFKKPDPVCVDQSSLVTTLSVLLGLCVSVLVVCGFAGLYLYRKHVAGTRVDNIDQNPEYGGVEEDHQSQIVDNNYYYD